MPGYEAPPDWPRAVFYEGALVVGYLDEWVDEDFVTRQEPAIFVSTDYGRYYYLQSVMPSVLTEGSIWYSTVRAIRYTKNGQIHVVLQEHELSDPMPLYYVRSDDFGATWTTPVMVGAADGPTWTGGIPKETPDSYYYKVELYVSGSNVAIGVLEYPRKLSYISVHDDLYIDYPFPLQYHYADNYQYYYPMDFLIKVSTDGGETFGEWTRIKNDEDQTVEGGGTKAWGYSADHPFIQDRGIAFGSCNGNLYIMSMLTEITKTMGGTPRSDDPFNEFWGVGFLTVPYAPETAPVFVSYCIPGWTGTPERTVIRSGYLTSRPSVVIDEDDETFIVFGTIGTGTSIYETFFNGEFTSNLVMSDVLISGDVSVRMWADWAIPLSLGGHAYLF
ncbi:MAG: hypothetical protein PHU71_06290 [Candidatus Gracilibacteria bacterium]|nr:hypothetical protein [Candidatus Gracilibacteria bacterium]